MNISIDNLINLINTTRNSDPDLKGRRFEITFVKKDGTERVMKARLGMRRNLKGKGMSYNPANYHMITVWDTQARAYRTVNLLSVSKLRLPDRSKHLDTINVGYVSLYPL